MEFYIRKLNEITQLEKQAISRLHFRDGFMYPRFKHHYSKGDDISRIVLARVDDKIVGWSLVWKQTYYDKFNVDVYVHSRFRNRSAGRELLNKSKIIAAKHGWPLSAAPHDAASRALFNDKDIIVIPPINGERRNT